MTFWQNLAKNKKPFLCLAPMEEVTDTVFRQMVARVAKPDVFFTEFTNVEGIAHFINSPLHPSLNFSQARGCAVREGTNPIFQRLLFSEKERPIVAQIWGKDPKNYYEAAKLIKKLRFDGVDINMGCPDKDVVKNGCGIALINNRSLAAEIIAAVKEGAGSASWRMPVSVKTRIGLDKIITEDWCGCLMEQKLDALTVHGRTAKEKSDGPEHWDEIAKVVVLRNQMFGGSNLQSRPPLVIGNGDVKMSRRQVRSQESGVDGVMIGRAYSKTLLLSALSPHCSALKRMLIYCENI